MERRRSAADDLLQDTSRRDVPLEVPLTSRRGEIVIDYSAGARTGVENTVLTYVDRHVVYSSPVAGKEKEISGLKCCHFER